MTYMDTNQSRGNLGLYNYLQNKLLKDDADNYQSHQQMVTVTCIPICICLMPDVEDVSCDSQYLR